MAKKQESRGPWPYGNPTKQCGECGGSGLSRASRDRYEQSRQQENSTKIAALRCGMCDGRGKVITTKADEEARAGLRCKHRILVSDCVVCRDGRPEPVL